MKTQSVNPTSERRGAVGRSLRRLVRMAFMAIWLPFFLVMAAVLICAALLATLIYPGKWKDGTWTRTYPNKADMPSGKE